MLVKGMIAQILMNIDIMENSMIKYVLQRADGQFYYKGRVSSSWGFTEDFNEAYLFDTEKGAKTRKSLPAAGENAKIRKVLITLLPEEDDAIYIPSVWIGEEVKKSPSMCSWASYKNDGTFKSGATYYDADGNEITKEIYEGLTGENA